MLVVEVGVAVGWLIVALGNLEEALSLVVDGYPQAGINTRRKRQVRANESWRRASLGIVACAPFYEDYLERSSEKIEGKPGECCFEYNSCCTEIL